MRILSTAVATHRGNVRKDNQDVLVLDGWAATSDRLEQSRSDIPINRAIIAAVIDGMGGQAGGGIAAWIVARRLVADAYELSTPDEAARALRAIHREVLTAGHGLGMPEMGAALAALILRPEGYSIFNVGDCRVYRVVDGAIGQISIDDSGPSRLDPRQTVLTQSVGGSEPYQIDPHWFSGSYGDGLQRFVVASDGLARADVSAIARAVLAVDPAAAAAGLIDATLAGGAPDNVSVLILDVGAVA